MVKERETWCAAAHGLQRVGHSLVTECQQHDGINILPSLWHHAEYFQCSKSPLCSACSSPTNAGNHHGFVLSRMLLWFLFFRTTLFKMS